MYVCEKERGRKKDLEGGRERGVGREGVSMCDGADVYVCVCVCACVFG